MINPNDSETKWQDRHDDIVRRFPGGLTRKQFRTLTLESADDSGKLDPPSIADWFAAQGILISMWLDGLIEKRCRRDESGPWYITENGRKALNPPTPKPDDAVTRESGTWNIP